jgi:hypothetical protein
VQNYRIKNWMGLVSQSFNKVKRMENDHHHEKFFNRFPEFLPVSSGSLWEFLWISVITWHDWKLQIYAFIFLFHDLKWLRKNMIDKQSLMRTGPLVLRPALPCQYLQFRGI